MLENSPLNPAAFSGPEPSAIRGRALRAVGWSDLTARINAARDLREFLKQDLILGAASFADAAAGYFVPPSDGKDGVNHDALEACKGLEDTESFNENAALAAPLEGSQEQGCRENK
ncbi:hypothetical protein [Altererythrobacter sp. GH1-8]|uniref:hypothetical protein n=1 Tax=Altererythrobacter sp. GH1-8 TaxID=3349333 RepID=UPI00374D2C14